MSKPEVSFTQTGFESTMKRHFRVPAVVPLNYTLAYSRDEHVLYILLLLVARTLDPFLFRRKDLLALDDRERWQS